MGSFLLIRSDFGFCNVNGWTFVSISVNWLALNPCSDYCKC